MNIFKGTIRGLAAVALAAGTFISQAAPVVSINPTTQDIAVGGTATVDIVVSGLTEPLGAFAFILGFDTSILLGLDSFSLDPTGQLGPAGIAYDGSYGFQPPAAPGTLDVLYSSGLAEADLASQASSFTLATISFSGIADGLSPLTFLSVDLSKVDGITTMAGVTSTNGSICVGNCREATVPEPASLLLLATALGLAGASRRRAMKT